MYVLKRLHLHRFVCDLDPVRDQADGEPQRVAGAARGAGGDFVFQVVLQGRVRTVHRVGVGESAAGGFRKAARMARGEGLARQGCRRVRLCGAGTRDACPYQVAARRGRLAPPCEPPTNQSTNKPTNHILGRRLSVLVGLVERRAPARTDSLPRQRRHVVAPATHRPIGS